MLKSDYSSDAINVLSRFYRSSTILYVEGDDDINFWKKVFENLSNIKVEIIPVGGALELDEKIKRITTENLKALAARDSDYVRLCGSHINDERIIYTYGYSIENTLYNPYSVASIISVLTRKNKLPLEQTTAWFDEFFSQCSHYLYFDIANHIFKLGIGLPDNCTGFMQSKKSHSIDQNKLLRFLIKEFGRELTSEEMNAVQEILNSNSLNQYLYFRGHFAASAAHTYISRKIEQTKKGLNCSYDSMYLGAIQSLREFLSIDSEHSNYYKNEISKVNKWLNSSPAEPHASS